MHDHGVPWLWGFSGWPPWKEVAGGVVNPVREKQACFKRCLLEARWCYLETVRMLLALQG